MLVKYDFVVNNHFANRPPFPKFSSLKNCYTITMNASVNHLGQSVFTKINKQQQKIKKMEGMKYLRSHLKKKNLKIGHTAITKKMSGKKGNAIGSTLSWLRLKSSVV